MYPVLTNPAYLPPPADVPYVMPKLQEMTEDFLYGGWVELGAKLGLGLDLHLPGAVADYEQVELHLMELVERAVAAYQPDPGVRTRLSHPDRKWRALSAIQKATRRANTLNAQRAAHAVHLSDDPHLWRRLPVNVMEDIGVADLYIAGIVMVLANKKAFRKKLGEWKVLAWVIEKMANAPKDRTSCDLLVYTGYNALSAFEKNQIAALPTIGELTNVLYDQSRPFVQRATAAWALAGTKRYQTEHLPGTDFGGNLVPAVLDGEGFPPLLTYVIEASGKRSREGLFIPALLAWEAMVSSPWIEAKFEPELLLDHQLLHGLPPSAFDMHTQEGKRAIAYFAKACKPVAQFFAERPSLKPAKALGITVFIVEGALLNHRLLYHGHDDLYRQVLAAELSDAGLIKEDGDMLVDLVRANLAALNQARARVLS